MNSVLKPSELRAETGKILDRAIKRPQYVNRNGVLLVITKAGAKSAAADDPLVSPWEVRSAALEKFYDPDKTW